MSDPRKTPAHSGPAAPDGDPPELSLDDGGEPVGYESALPFLRAFDLPAFMPGDTAFTSSLR